MLNFNYSPEQIAKSLLGKYLVVRRKPSSANASGGQGKIEAYKIIETEAYVGPHDKASHAYRGRTKRNEVMFGPPGHWYVYLCYGMHHMLNLVTGPKDYPAAVLIRGVEGPHLNKRRPSSLMDYERRPTSLIIGPGRVTKALGIGKELNGKLVDRRNGLWIEDRGEKVNSRDIIKTPRIGIAYAEEWKDKPLRFILKEFAEGGKSR